MITIGFDLYVKCSIVDFDVWVAVGYPWLCGYWRFWRMPFQGDRLSLNPPISWLLEILQYQASAHTQTHLRYRSSCNRSDLCKLSFTSLRLSCLCPKVDFRFVIDEGLASNLSRLPCDSGQSCVEDQDSRSWASCSEVSFLKTCILDLIRSSNDPAKRRLFGVWTMPWKACRAFHCLSSLTFGCYVSYCISLSLMIKNEGLSWRWCRKNSSIFMLGSVPKRKRTLDVAAIVGPFSRTFFSLLSFLSHPPETSRMTPAGRRKPFYIYAH